MRFSLLLLTLITLGCFPVKTIHMGARGNGSGSQRSLLDTCNSKECLLKVIKADPNNVEAHWWLGTKLQAEQNYPEAMHELDIAIKLDSSYNLGFPYRDRANCKNNLRDNKGAVEDMTAAIRLNPTERYFYYDRGNYLYNLQQFDAALKDFNTALEIFDKYEEARTWKAKILTVLEKYPEALTEYQALNFSDAFINDPQNAYDIYYRGLAEFHTGDKNKACHDWIIAAPNCDPAKEELKTNCKIK